MHEALLWAFAGHLVIAVTVTSYPSCDIEGYGGMTMPGERVEDFEQVRAWWETADDGVRLYEIPQAARAAFEEAGGIIGENGDRLMVLLRPRRYQEHQRLREKEYGALLKILEDALVWIEPHDADQAARLAARAYVNLKSDPVRQRRFDGLLHRFTGVYHRRS